MARGDSEAGGGEMDREVRGDAGVDVAGVEDRDADAEERDLRTCDESSMMMIWVVLIWR